MADKAATKLEKLNLVDRFLFDETMEDPKAYQAAVSILLENEIVFPGKTETEKEFRVSPQLRQVRLDVVGMDRRGAVYYTEMQKKNTGNLKRRSRYYQAQLDVSLLEPGSTDFNLLNDSCLILIAPFDIFGRGLYRYTFQGACAECPDLKLEDGAVRVFINTKGTNQGDFSKEFLDFMGYITASTDDAAADTDSKRIKLIHDRVKQIRLSEKMGVRYMQRWEEIAYARQDGIAEGHLEGRSEGEERLLIRMICKKLQKGKTPDAIAEELEEELDEESEKIRCICKAAAGYAPDYDNEKIYQALHETEESEADQA